MFDVDECGEVTKAIHSMMFAVGSLEDAKRVTTGTMQDYVEALRKEAAELQAKIEKLQAAEVIG